MSPESKERVKKLVSAIEIRIEAVETTGASKSKNKYLENLVQIMCIQYPIIFWKKSVLMSALFDLDNEVNAINLIFAKELGLSSADIDFLSRQLR